MELMTPGGNITFTLEQMENRKGEMVEVAPGSGHRMRIPVPADLPGNTDFGLLLRNI
jgi:putative protease